MPLSPAGEETRKAIQTLADHMEHLTHAHQIVHETRDKIVEAIKLAQHHGLMPADMGAVIKQGADRAVADVDRAVETVKSASEQRILGVLKFGHGDVDQICRQASLMKATVAPLLERMVERGTVERTIASDGRMIYKLAAK